MADLVFVTGNMDKLHWVEKFLGSKLDHHKLDLEEIQNIDPHKVLEHKAREAYRILQKPVLVEDTSLVFHALGRLPGPFVRYFLEELGEADGLIKLLAGFEDKSITQTVLFGIYDGKDFKIFEASASGKLPDSPAVGEMGFGFDKVFVPDGKKYTRADMTEEEYALHHPRQAAVLKLADFLKQRQVLF